MDRAPSLRYPGTSVKDSDARPAKVAPVPEVLSSVRPAPAPGLERDRAQPVRGDAILYMPLSAFGLYAGVILAVRENGTVDVGLHKLGGINQHIDLQLTKIELVESREKVRPGTCFIEKQP